MPVNGSVLELLNVSAGYGPEPAIRGIDLAVRPGEFVGLVGPNGSGKSTLLKAALGLLPLRSGEVRLFGTPLGAFRDWRRVGYVPQQVAAIGAAFPASVREVVAMGRYSHAGPLRPFSRDDQSAVREAMERTGIDRFGRKLVNELSGGERQRVFLARALAGRPDLLLLDEPTASIDPDGRVQLTQLIGALNRERGVTVVFVSHDLPLLRGHLTRVVLINRTILFEGSPDELERRAEFGVFLEEAHHFEHVIRGED